MATTCGHTIANSLFVLQGQFDRMWPSSNSLKPVRMSQPLESVIAPVASWVSGFHSARATAPRLPICCA